MSYSDFKKLLYDLHKENKVEMKEFRKELCQLNISFKEHLQFHKTVQGLLVAGAGIGGGVISVVIASLIKNMF